MRTHRFSAVLAGLSAFFVLATAPLGAQLREVVSSRISVSSRDATLELDFVSGDGLEIGFQNGQILVDGEAVGEYTRGDRLDDSWRSLLADAVQLDDGPLARALVDWSPPSTLEGGAAALGRRLDETLEDRLAASTSTAEADDAPQAAQGTGVPGGERELGRLFRRTDRLEALAEALEGLDLGDVQIRVDEDVTVTAEEQIQATLVVVDGDLDVQGSVDGNVVVTGGALRIYDGGRITGDVRLVDARIFRNGGEIFGTVSDVEPERTRALEALQELENLGNLEDLDELEDLEDEIRSRVRDELRHELRDEIRSELRDRYRDPGIFAPLRSVGRGLAGLFQNLITFVIVVVLGGVVIHFFPENLERVADTARRSPGRAGLVGVAGTFLLVPVWILGVVALAISIIGIPALLAWIPLFPVAAGLAAGLGYLAVARLVGGWIADQGIQGLDFLRPTNSVHAVAAGVGLLLIPFAAANVVQMAGPWLGFVEGLFLTVGWMAGVAAVAVGFGAVLLSRGGRAPHGPAADGPYDDFDWPSGGGPSPEPGLGTEPTTGSTPEADDARDDEREWEQTWEDLEEEARSRAAEDSNPGPAGPEGTGPSEAGDDEASGEATDGTSSPDDGEGGKDESRRTDDD